MNVKIGTEAAQFPEKEYINGIFFAVRVYFILYHAPGVMCTNMYIQMPLDKNILQKNHTPICMLYGCPFYPCLCMRTVTTIVLWRA
jgi:hypothetical protein